jgi:hypothetical protein
MSVFASRVTKQVEIPFDVPNTVTVQKLTGRQLTEAQEMFTSNSKEWADFLIRHGVLKVNDEPLTEEQRFDLTAEAMEFFATEVLRLTKPSLFEVTKEEAKAARKKGVAASTTA